MKTLNKAIGLLALCAPVAWAGPTEDLVKILAGVQSMQAGFEQTILDRGGTRLQQAGGELAVARPNQFYWHAEQPFEQVIVSNGQRVSIYDVDLEQVIERPLSGQMGATPALLFSGQPEQVATEFRVELGEQEGNRRTFRLTPTGEDPLFTALEVSFDGQAPETMRLEDALGQQTIIDFVDVRLNGSVEAALFRFTPPAGVDVIREDE
ncbi:outer membrane lipoprotein chaperone LolA [Isoalcanivorax beigongshangi]|uniref:Outer-membrane lipoprotein carrier protein n=1 Tax=Isoalcanivorax beigongshangi TaxID=3238810 RepID=A0ABV4AHD3_9GAMM